MPSGPGDDWTCVSLCVPLRNEYVSETPHGLDITGPGNISLDQAAQAGDLNIHAAIRDDEAAMTRKLEQALPRQRLARMTAQDLEYGELSLRQYDDLSRLG